MNYKKAILATLDEHPEWGEYGATGPLYEMFDCADSTVQYYIGTWRKIQQMGFVLEAVVKSKICDSCACRDICRSLIVEQLPVLCERVTKDEQMILQQRGQWGDVLRSRVDATA